MASNPSVNLVNHRADRMRYAKTSPDSLTSPLIHNSCRFQCTWVKNSIQKPQTEKFIDSIHECYSDLWRYTIYLESRLDECSQYQHPNVDFRANRPSDDALLGQEDDSDVMTGGDDNDHGSDDGNDHTVAICNIPPQNLQVR